MSITPATAEQIIEVLWKRLRDGTAHSCNWGTALDNSIWHVGPHTYINGIMATIDFDYEGMWLLEVCDTDREDPKDPCLVRWLAVGTTSKGGKQHAWYPVPNDLPQPFFARTVNAWDVIPWACEWYKALDLARS